MPVNSVQTRSVLFQHLACAYRYRVNAPIALVDLGCADAASARFEGIEHIWVIQLRGRDAAAAHFAQEFMVAAFVDSYGPDTEPAWHCDVAREECDEIVLRCSKCTTQITMRLAALAMAARQHPRIGFPASSQTAYLADRGEVVYRLDAHAEELVRRDKRDAQRRHGSGRPRLRVPVSALGGRVGPST